MTIGKQAVGLLLALLLLSHGAGGERICRPSLRTKVVLYGGTIAGTFAGVFVGGPLILGALGFGTAGIAAGSTAAGIQSAIGNVGGGTLFAKLQSLGMTGVNLKTAATFAAWAGKSGMPEYLETILGLDCEEV